MTPLIQASIFLRNAAPNEFAQFVEAFNQHADKLTLDVLSADAAHIMTVKGAALEARSLLEDFKSLDRYLSQPSTP